MKKALLLVLVMAVLSGCSKSGGTKSDTAGGSDEPVTLTMMANLYMAELGRADKAFLDVVKENTNVSLEVEIPASSGYAEKLQLMLVSGEYPDIVMFQKTESDVYINAVESGVLLPLDDYLKNAPNIMKYTYDSSWKALRNDDGNIYGIPRTSIKRADGYWFRKDWLDNLGISFPENAELTLEQFNEIIRAFTFDDPDGNGMDDTYGIGAQVDREKVMAPVFTSQFGDYGWQESDGDYKYINAKFDKDTSRYKKILSYTRDLYLQGILDPNSAVNDLRARLETFYAGQTGVTPSFVGKYLEDYTNVTAVNPKAEIIYGFVQNEEGVVKGTLQGTGMWQFWCVTSACESPEKAVEVMDYALSDDGYDKLYAGVEGVSYDVVDGKRVYKDDIFEQKEALVPLFLRRAGDADFFTVPWTDDAIKEIIKPSVAKAVNSAVSSMDSGYVPQISTDPVYMDYQATMAEGIAKILLGAAEVDTYDALLAGWYENGGETYVQQMNDFIVSSL